MGNFPEYLQKNGRSRQTQRGYIYWVNRARAEGLDLAKCTGADIQEWLEAIPETHSTRACIRSALNAYWDFIDRKKAPRWAVSVPKAPVYTCRAITDEEAKALACLALRKRDNKGLAALLALYAALRRAEIAALRWTNVKDEWLSLVGKGYKEARIPLHPQLQAILKTYPHTHPTWVFPSPYYPTHISPHAVWDWIQRLAMEAGIRHVSPHELRHTCLAVANDGSSDMRAVSQFARHTRLETTGRYTRTLTQRLVDVVGRIQY